MESMSGTFSLKGRAVDAGVRIDVCADGIACSELSVPPKDTCNHLLLWHPAGTRYYWAGGLGLRWSVFADSIAREEGDDVS